MTVTVSAQRVTVHTVRVTRATGALLSCWFGNGKVLGGCCGGGGVCGGGCVPGTATITGALLARALPPPFVALTSHRSGLPTSSAWTVYEL